MKITDKIKFADSPMTLSDMIWSENETRPISFSPEQSEKEEQIVFEVQPKEITKKQVCAFNFFLINDIFYIHIYLF